MSNLIKRTIFGALYGAVVISATAVFPQAFVLLAIIFLYGMMNEFFRMSMGGRNVLEQKLTILSAFLLLVLDYLHLTKELDARFISAAALPLLAAIVSVIFGNRRAQLDRYVFIFTAFVYIGIPTALSPFLIVRNGVLDGWLLLDFFIIIWMSDIGAYSLGTLFGQKAESKKLAPQISPKKSWWGFWGAIICGIIASVILKYAGVLDFHIVHCVVIGILVSVCSVVGDLVESVWKRHFGVKDSGNVIPGHGGFLDRMDSSLVAIPAASIYLLLFNLI